MLSLPDDPLELKNYLWPDVVFAPYQEDIVYSVEDNVETYVVASNEAGKDFVAGFIVLWYFLTRWPCRIVTTSAKEAHLRVLWGEISKFIRISTIPLAVDQGGMLVLNHQDIRKVYKGKLCSTSYIIGLVASEDTVASMGGHHAAPPTLEEANDGVPRTLWVADEASSIPDRYYPIVVPWAKRLLIFGNAWQCESFFRRGIDGGDVKDERGGKYFRKMLRVTAEDSPNVKYARAQIAAGLEPTGEVIIPGIKTWHTLQRDLVLYDEKQKCVSLNAQFYTGPELYLFPPAWLDRAHELYEQLLRDRTKRVAKAIGVDPGEGGANSSQCAVDGRGIIELESHLTPDTTDVVKFLKAFIQSHRVKPEDVAIDRGGGGKQHADTMRLHGYNVRTVAFGEAISVEVKRAKTLFPEKREVREERYAYVNRRAQMFHELSLLLDPTHGHGFAIPGPHRGEVYKRLRHQLSKILKQYDENGRIMLPPKHRKPGQEETKQKTLVELIGASPDEADSLVLACFAMNHKPIVSYAGAAI